MGEWVTFFFWQRELQLMTVWINSPFFPRNTSGAWEITREISKVLEIALQIKCSSGSSISKEFGLQCTESPSCLNLALLVQLTPCVEAVLHKQVCQLSKVASYSEFSGLISQTFSIHTAVYHLKNDRHNDPAEFLNWVVFGLQYINMYAGTVCTYDRPTEITTYLNKNIR